MAVQAIGVMFLQVAVAPCSWMPSRMLTAAATQLCRDVVPRWTERWYRVCKTSSLFVTRSPRSHWGHERNGFFEEFRPRSADQGALLAVQIAMTLLLLVAFVLTAFGVNYQEQGSDCTQGFFSTRAYAFACVFFGGAFLNCRSCFSIPLI